MSPFEEYYDAFVTVLARHIARKLPPTRPHRISVTLTRETADMLIFAVHLPAPASPDLSKRTLHIVVNGGEPTTQPAVDGGELSFNRGDAVSISLVDTSADGVDSLPSEALLFTAINPTPPAQPGPVTVTFLREETPEPTA